MTDRSKLALWLRWVAVNAVGEWLGLGGTLAVAGFAISRLENQASLSAVLVSFLIAVLSGAIEATLVGFAQWWAMHPWFTSITRRDWWLATLVGALMAYVLGYLPSTIMNLGEQASQTPMPEPPPWIVLLLAGGLGLVAGTVLSFAQWLELRKHVDHAAAWIPANMLAWLLGMPLIFLGIDAAQKGQTIWQVILLMSGALLLAGAVVGAVHGAFLAWLARRARLDLGQLRLRVVQR